MDVADDRRYTGNGRAALPSIQVRQVDTLANGQRADGRADIAGTSDKEHSHRLGFIGGAVTSENISIREVYYANVQHIEYSRV